MIRVPPVIRRCLARSYDMHNIPIGSKEVFNHMQNLPKNIGFFFAGNSKKFKSRVFIRILIFDVTLFYIQVMIKSI